MKSALGLLMNLRTVEKRKKEEDMGGVGMGGDGRGVISIQNSIFFLVP